MKKVYIDPREYLRDSWRLARKVLDSGWTPDFLVALWRGGAVPGVAVHEFLAVNGMRLAHLPLACASYGVPGERSLKPVFSGAEQVLARIGRGKQVLVVDDVFDMGVTAQAVREAFARNDCAVKFACVYLKPSRVTVDFLPDFFVRACDDWLVFPHEIEGLRADEMGEKDPVLSSLMTSAGSKEKNDEVV